MAVLDHILAELDEMYIVNNVTKQHDEARNMYPIRVMTVSDDIEFDNMIADYYNFHFGKCISHGANLSRSEAAGRAKEIIAKEYSSRGMKKVNAYYDGKNGTNSGMYRILDTISESIKEDAVERHIRDVLDRYIQPSSFPEKVSIIIEIFNMIGRRDPHIDYEYPERYASNYEELVRAIANYLKTQSMIFRRL